MDALKVALIRNKELLLFYNSQRRKGKPDFLSLCQSRFKIL